MKKLNITYDTFEVENGERVEGETCYTVEIGDDKVADSIPRFAAFQCNLSADDFRRRCESCSGNHRTRYGGYAGEHLRPYPAVLPRGTG